MERNNWIWGTMISEASEKKGLSCFSCVSICQHKSICAILSRLMCPLAAAFRETDRERQRWMEGGSTWWPRVDLKPQQQVGGLALIPRSHQKGCTRVHDKYCAWPKG